MVFKALYARHIGDWDELYRREDVTMGYSTFIQYTLSRELIRHGVQQARAALPAGVNHPHFMPAQGGRPPKDPAASAIPKRCEFRHGDQIHFYDDARNSTGTLGFSHCKQCYRELLPAIPGERESQPLFRRQTHFGCAGCRVNLCSQACFQAYDHVNNERSVCQVVRYAAVVPGSAVGPAVQTVPTATPSTGRTSRRSGAAAGLVSGGDFRKAPSGRPFGPGSV